MRFLLSALAGLLFLAAFIAFFLLTSVVGYVDSPDRLVASAREGGLRDTIIEQTSQYIVDQVAADSSLQNMSVPEVRGIVAGVITQEWLDGSLTLAHGAVKNAIHGAEASAVLDLREIKTALGQALSNLADRAEMNCENLLGAQACSNAQESKRMVAAFERSANAAIAQLDDEIDLMQELQGSSREEAKRLQEGLESMETVRMLALVVLIMSLAFFIILNHRPFGRFAVATGVLGIVSSATYLVAIAVSEGIAQDALAKQAGREAGPEAGELAARLTNELVSGAISGSTLPVVLVGVAGLALVVVGMLTLRR